MEINSLVGNEFVKYPGGETSPSLPKSKYENNPISASGSSKNRKTVTKMISRMFNIHRNQCSPAIVVLLIINIFILILGYYVLIKKLTASSQLSENLSSQLANVENRTRGMEAAVIAQGYKLTASSQLSENLSSQLANVENRTRGMEAAVIAQGYKLTASSQFSGNLTLQLANIANRTKVMEASAIAQEKKFTEFLVKNALFMDSQEARSKCRWVPSYSGELPPGAMVVGNEKYGEKLFVARVYLRGALLPGKLVQSKDRSAYIPWEGEEIPYHSRYAVLCDCAPRWLPMTNSSEIPAGAFIAGETKDGQLLYLGRAEHDGFLIPGRVEPILSDTTRKPYHYMAICFIPFYGNEIRKYNFEIMVL